MTHRIKQLGMSLIELMVAMVIGLVVMLVVFQLFAVSEGTRRTSVAGSDAQMSAAIAITALQDQVRTSGYGLTDSFRDVANSPFRALGCNVRGVDVRTNAAGDPITYPGAPLAGTFPFVPVFITQGADNAPTGVGRDSDTITVLYSGAPYPMSPTNLFTTLTTATQDLRVKNRYGIIPGDVLVVAESMGVPATMTCTLVEATGTPTVAGELDLVKHGIGVYPNLAGQNKNVRFNTNVGVAPLFTVDSAVYNLGQAPALTTFSVQNGQLVMINRLGATTPAALPLVDGIAALQAQYAVGVDTDADTFADQFDPAGGQGSWKATLAPGDTPGLIVAVRLAILARSNLIERKDGSGNCTATPAGSPELVWAGGNFDVSNVADWNCYRYKKFEAVIPLRNTIWMPTT